jgi:26S proteasome subunit P45 family
MITLKVAEALQNDIGRGIARIDSKAKKGLGVSTGDIVKLSGKKSCLAIVWQAHSEDEGLDMIRIDGILRQNAGVGLGDRLKLDVVQSKEAKKVLLTPRERVRFSAGFEQYVKKRLIGKPVLKGNLLPVGIFGTSVPLVVSQVYPQGAVVISEQTELKIATEPLKELENIPNVTYDDVGGLRDAMQKIREMVELPLRHPEIFERLGIDPPKGVLLYGPPGTGKTLLAKAVANESDASFHYIGGPEVVSKYVGESEERLRKIFLDAQESAPSIIFIDEIDAIAPKRGDVIGEVEKRLVSTLLTMMDGLKSRGEVIVIGASVAGDTPILVKDAHGIKLTPIGAFVDSFYDTNEADVEKKVDGVWALGFDSHEPKNNFSAKCFNKSAFKKVRGVFRHYVNEIYEIHYRGGTVRTTGNHSVFVRTRQGVKVKPVVDLRKGDTLVEIPFKVQRTNGKLPLIRSHQFPNPDEFHLELPISNIAILRASYDMAKVGESIEEYNSIAYNAGVSLSTIQNWHSGKTTPARLQTKLAANLPDTVVVTPDLVCLLGYYTAEGYSRCELDFCFGSHEVEFHKDLQEKMHSVFNVKCNMRVTGSRTNLIYPSKFLAEFFSEQCGKGAHNKHVPPWLFEAPRCIFLGFLLGYLRGDGCKITGKKKGYQATSVSKQLILELNWLCRMHGIKSSISSFTAKAGREIAGKKIEKETKAWRLSIGISSDPFALVVEKHKHIKRPIVKEVRRVPFDGYVYDLCGCDNEAFFGGESPLLLHNTNREDSLDPALRRPGRFDREIEIGVPSKIDRLEILQIHIRNMPLEKDVSVDELAAVSHGYTGADLSLLTKEAALKALRRVLPQINIDEDSIPQEILDNLKVTRDDFFNGLREIMPSALREVFIERPNVKWDDVGGLDKIKKELQEAVELPLKSPETFEKMGIRPIKGILLYGPPGTGKTLLAKAVANETEANFIGISGAQILSKWVGESEKAVREVFKKARMAAPCILFIDEIDAIAPTRSGASSDGGRVTERVVDTLLTELDGLESLKNVVVIAASNRPDMLDAALMRAGRFDRIVEIDLPDQKARASILKIHTNKMPLDSDVSLDELASLTEGYTGADLENLVREAGMNAIRQESKKVKARHFQTSLGQIIPATKKEHVERIAKFKQSSPMYR